MIIKTFYRIGGVVFWVAVLLYASMVGCYVFLLTLIPYNLNSIKEANFLEFVALTGGAFVLLDVLKNFFGHLNSSVHLAEKMIFCKDDHAYLRKIQHAVSVNYEDILAVLFTTSTLTSNDKPRHVAIAVEIPFIMIVEKSGITKKISPFNMSFKQVKAMLLALKNNCEIIGNPIKIDVDSIMSSYKNYYKKIF